MLKGSELNPNLEAEAVLDSEIQFDQPLSEHNLQPKSIFLTGATGLLGAYLVDDLVKSTEATIYCLVRKSGDQSPEQRLIKHMESYQLWGSDHASRVVAVEGDLAAPGLGMSESWYNKIAEECDVIFHNGAHISFVRPYKDLKPANVNGTHEVIRLASLHKTKPVHFVSTLAVFLSKARFSGDQIAETTSIKYDTDLKGGYKQSKWVAERLIDLAQERGLPVTIFRPVRISGGSDTGITQNFDDFMFRLIKGCLHLGVYPDLDIKVTMVPADYVARSIVHLSFKKGSYGRAFHLFHPQPTTWQELMSLYKELGYTLKELPFKEWMEVLKPYTRQKENKEFFSLLYFFMRKPNNLLAKKPKITTADALKELEEASIVCPEIDQNLMGVYTSFLRSINYFPDP